MKKFERNEHGICIDDFRKIKTAETILGNCISDVSGGTTVNGKDYVPLYALESREDVKDALETIATVYGITIVFENNT